MYRVITEENGKKPDLAIETPCEVLARHTAETLVLPRGGRITLFKDRRKQETVYCLPITGLTARPICPSMAKVKLTNTG